MDIKTDKLEYRNYFAIWVQLQSSSQESDSSVVVTLVDKALNIADYN